MIIPIDSPTDLFGLGPFEVTTEPPAVTCYSWTSPIDGVTRYAVPVTE
jgi:hypothetical protein